MEMLIGFGHTILSFVVILSVIVFIHEFGHYIIAKLSGVKIEVFSIGFGREIFGWNDKTGTRWKFSLLPFGGYVKMFGDAGAASNPDNDILSKMTAEEKVISFYFKPLWNKALIVAGGPIFNFLLTIIIFAWFAYSNGITSTQPIVGEVMENSAAQEAGLLTGDRILKVNNAKIETFHDIPTQILTNLGTQITLVLDRNGEEITLNIVPRIVESVDDYGNKLEQPLIGIRSQQLTFEQIGILRATTYAVTRTWEISVATLQVLGQLITGQRDADQLKGPIGIAQMSGQAADAGFNNVLWFIALLSANLGLVNLLPIPMLDGGHLLFYAVEGIQGKPMAVKAQEFAFKFGIALLVSLMAFTIINDIVQLT